MNTKNRVVAIVTTLVAFVSLAFSFAGQSKAATIIDNPYITNQSTMVNKDGLEAGIKFQVGSEGSMYSANQNAVSALIDVNGLKNQIVNQVVTFTNTSNEVKDVSEFVTLNRYYINYKPESEQVAVVDDSGIKFDNSLNIGYSIVPGDYKKSYDDVKDQLAKVLAFKVTGKLAPGQTATITVPLKLQHYNVKDIAASSDQNTIAAEINNFGDKDPLASKIKARLVDKYQYQPKAVNDRYLAVYRKTANGNTTYDVAPQDVQKLMPHQNANNEIKIDNFNFDLQNPAPESVLYTGGSIYIVLDSIKAAIADAGYSVAVKNDGELYDYYSYHYYANNMAVNDPATNKPYVRANDQKNSMVVEVRKVVDIPNKEVTIKQHAKFDANKYVTIYDRKQNKVALNSSDVKVTGKVNPDVVGTYTLKYTYLPDNTSNTLTVHVVPEGGNAGGGGAVVPSETTYQVDFNSNGGSSVTSQTVKANDKISEPNAPTKAGFDFAGWYLDKGLTQKYDFNSPVTGHTALYAKWVADDSLSSSYGNDVVAKGKAIYAIKKIGLYKKTNFTNQARVKFYAKAKRVNRPEFVVKGYARDKNGKLRYIVQQYDPYVAKYVKGTKGYITASRKYVVPAYYATMPTNKQIRIINKNGANVYSKKALRTGKVRHYKKGAIVKVKKIVTYKYTTRYVLSDGNYITGNKKFVIFK